MPGTRRICKNTSQALQWWWRQILHVSTIFSPSTPRTYTKNQLLRCLTAKNSCKQKHKKFSAYYYKDRPLLQPMLRNWTHTQIQETATKVVIFYILSDNNIGGVTDANTNCLSGMDFVGICVGVFSPSAKWQRDPETFNLLLRSVCRTNHNWTKPIVTLFFPFLVKSKFFLFCCSNKWLMALPQVPSDTQTDDPRTTVKLQPQTANHLFDFSNNLQETKRWVCYSDYPFEKKAQGYIVPPLPPTTKFRYFKIVSAIYERNLFPIDFQMFPCRKYVYGRVLIPCGRCIIETALV